MPFVPGAGVGVDGPWPYISLPISKRSITSRYLTCSGILAPDLSQNISLFAGLGWFSYIINSSACPADGSPPCPSQPTVELLSTSEVDPFAGPVGDVYSQDPGFAYLMNVTGSGTPTLETLGFITPSNSTLTPLPSTVSYLASNLTVNYPGGADYSWNLDVGIVCPRLAAQLSVQYTKTIY